MKIANLTNANGNAWANQIVITGELELGGEIAILQSYETKVAMIDYDTQKIDLADEWDYSATTRKAVYKFLDDFIGFDFKSNKKIISSALELGIIRDTKGRVWEISPACHDFFEILGALKA